MKGADAGGFFRASEEGGVGACVLEFLLPSPLGGAIGFGTGAAVFSPVNEAEERTACAAEHYCWGERGWG
jgi:hypothetical protein